MISQALICTVLLFGSLYAIVFLSPTREVIGYDCRMAEIVPDVPIKVKEMCRILWIKNSIANK